MTAVKSGFMRILRAAFFAASCCLFAASLTALMPFSVFLSDLPSHFPVYILMAAPVLAVLAFALRFAAPVMLPAMLGAGISFMQIYPFLPLAAQSDAAAGSFKLLQINVYTSNQNTAPLAALIAEEDPDIVVIAELNHAFTQMGEQLGRIYPHRHYFGQTAVLSRLPLERIDLAPNEGVFSRPQFFTAVSAGRHFTLATFHASAPPLGFARRELEFAEFSELVQSLRQSGRIKDPLVFAGDINVTPYAPAMKKLSYDLRLRNAREGFGLLHSWPVWLPAPLRIPIDHVLVGPEISVLDYRLGPPIGSDHLPTIAVLTLTGPQ
jgi:endonuclease/exonuclease/phosphatase (EEP) superfamily protein YafD